MEHDRETNTQAVGAGVTPADLAELVAGFTGVASRLQATHETLRAEVAHLKSELGRANEQLERSRRLAALGEMAAGIAHEVRNPLSSIALYARMLRQDLRGQEQPQRLAEKIGRAVRDLDAVVGDVLAFAREMRIRPGPVDASEALTRALEACAPEFDPVEVRRTDLARGPVAFEADAALVQQALVNVIRNAFEAMAEVPARGRVLELDAQPRPDGGAALRVRDSGAGVSEEVEKRMFNPFFTTRATGTGLGLAIVHRIVDAHGGGVCVVNARALPRPGPGTLVEMVFPAARSPAVVIPRRSAPQAAA